MSMAIKYAMKKRAKQKGVHESPDWQPEKGKSYAGTAQRAGNSANSDDEKSFQHGESKDEHRRVLDEMRSMKKPNLMAEGGEMHGDMVDRIMQRRCYSKGGMVANGGDADLDEMADGRVNNFDDLALRDDLEFAYTGANSGDELDNEQEDQDRHDIVARIMRSRAKKDRNPRPA